MTAEDATKLVHSKSPPHSSVRVEEKLRPEEMQRRCATLHVKDKAAEKRKNALVTAGILGLIAAMIIFMIAGATELQELLLASFVTAAVAILAFVLRPVLGAGDVDDRKLDVPRCILDTLHSEMQPKRPVELMLDCRGYFKTKPLTNSSGILSATGAKVYEKLWCRLKFTLLDGTQLQLQVKSTCKRKQKRKRKYVKIKDVVVDHVSIDVRTPKGRQLDPASEPKARKVFSAAKGAVQTGLRVKPTGLQVGFRLGPGYRTRARNGWTSMRLDSLFDGPRALMLVLLSVRAMRSTLVK